MYNKKWSAQHTAIAVYCLQCGIPPLAIGNVIGRTAAAVSSKVYYIKDNPTHLCGAEIINYLVSYAHSILTPKQELLKVKMSAETFKGVKQKIKKEELTLQQLLIWEMFYYSKVAVSDISKAFDIPPLYVWQDVHDMEKHYQKELANYFLRRKKRFSHNGLGKIIIDLDKTFKTKEG